MPTDCHALPPRCKVLIMKNFWNPGKKKASPQEFWDWFVSNNARLKAMDLNDLINEPLILLCAADHMLQRHDLARLWIHHCIDNACRTFADFVDHFVAE